VIAHEWLKQWTKNSIILSLFPVYLITVYRSQWYQLINENLYMSQAAFCPSDLESFLLNSPLTALTPLPTARKRAPNPKLMPLTRTV
jgi:hypothetical protein